MFQRRTPRTILQNLKQFLWPSMGWGRAWQYVKFRVLRLSDTPRNIALGLAIGAGISFTPFVGTHIIQAGIIAYFLRANLAASLIGTLVGNPWTFAFMWWGAISFGSFLFGLFGLPASTALPDTVTLSIVWDLIKHEPLRIFAPWLVGGYLLALLSTPLSYAIFYRMIRVAKNARRRARILNKRRASRKNNAHKHQQKDPS